MAGCPLHQLHTPEGQKRRLTNEDGVRPIVPDSGKSRIDLAARVGIENLDLYADSTSGRFYGSQC